MPLRLDESLFDTYRQYKSEEKALIQWLVDTVAACDRKTQNIKSATRITNNASATSKRPSILEILPLVETISEDVSVKKVPIHIVTCLSNVTTKRTRCSEWYKRNTRPDDNDALRLNQSHEYPLQILRYATKLLGSKLSSTSEKQTAQQAAPTVEESAAVPTNKFGVLTIDEREEQEDAITGIGLNEKSGTLTDSCQAPKQGILTPIPQTSYDVLNEELLMRHYCMLQDLEAIESAIIQEWISYVAGSQTLMGAAIITDQTLDFVRQLEVENFMRQDESLSGGPDSYLWIMRKPVGLFATLRRTDAGNIVDPLLRMQEIIYKLMLTRRNADSPDWIAAYAEVDVIASPGDYFDAPVDKQANHDRTVFVGSNLIFRQSIFSRAMGKETQLIRALRCLSNQVEPPQQPELVPMFIAFAVRIQGLILAICGDDADAIGLQLQYVMDIIECQTGEYLKCLRSKSPIFANSKDHITSQMIRISESLLEVLPGHRSLVQPVSQGMRWKVLQAALPVWECWQSLTNILATGLRVTGICEAVADIFAVCQKEGILSDAWPDLDFLVAHTDEEYVYGGPKLSLSSRSQYLHHFTYKHGIGSISHEMNGEKLDLQFHNARRTSRTLFGRQTSAFNMWALLSIFQAGFYSTKPFENPASDQLRLYLRAVNVQKMIGGPPKAAIIEGAEEDGVLVIRNQNDLLKVTRRGPELRIVHLTALLRKELKTELELTTFEFLDFYKGLVHLTARLDQLRRGVIRDSGTVGGKPPQCAKYHAQHAAISVCTDLQAAELATQFGTEIDPVADCLYATKVGKVFSDWLATKSAVGVGGTARTLLCNREKQHLSQLRPSLLKKLEEIHTKYGTLDDLFTADQREGIPWLQETTKVEDVMKEMYGKKCRSAGKVQKVT